MKKLICILSAMLLMFGCTDLSDVAEDGIGKKDVEGGGSGIDNPAAALTGVYSQLNGLSDQGNTYALMEHTSDEMMGPTRGTDWSDFGVWRQLHLHTWDPSHSQVLGTWNQLNSGVFRASQVIESSAASAQQIAEAKFLRALFMFYVMDLYGQVPFREVTAGPNDIPDVMSRAEAFDFIVNDLTSARPDLPNLASGADAARASQESVDFLLAKLHLNKAVYTQATAENPAIDFTFDDADMDEVISRVENLEANGYLALYDYWGNFHWENTENSTELVFVRNNEPGSAPASVFNFYYMTTHYNQTPSGWNGFTTIAEFYDRFTDEDDIRKGTEFPGMTDEIGLRAGFLEGQQYDGEGNPLEDRGGNPLIFTKEVDLLYSNERMGIRAIKYLVDPDNIDNPGTDFFIFRYADALLMKAEAHLRKGETGEALSIVNTIREDRGADPLTSIDEQAMLNERGYELYWEGWRRNDQIRFGTFTDSWTAKDQSEPYRVLFPIPQKALDTNPNLVQNSGY